MTPNAILIMMIFGAIGMGYIVHGKNQGHAVSMITGVLLCAYPYVISGIIPLILVGLVLTVAPFVLKTG